jgi:serine protease AprX
VDSGNFKSSGLGARLLGEVNFNSSEHTSTDQYGHGTHVTGIIADDGTYSGGQYMGVAPKVNILGLRVSDDYGMSYESDVVAALQWVYNNKTAYNIKVVNISMNSSVAQSYHTSPLDAAVEILWFNSIVVVVSAGNNGTANLYPPANDPFVITVGATDDKNTVDLADDIVTTFSAYGVDESGRVKPDLVAPGRNLIAFLPDVNSLTISQQYPQNQVNSYYFRMSGTSMSAPVVSGAVALLLQKAQETGVILTPDQVKYRLMATANKNWAGYDPTRAGAGLLDVFAALNSTTTQSMNTGILPSQLLSTGSNPISWGSVGWNTVGWNTVGWNTVGWNTVGWNTVSWNSDYWGQ